MKRSRRGRGVLFLLVICGPGLVAACGKKGPPLPPLARVPAAPGSPQAARFGDEVYIWFTVPAANVSGEAPADVASIDLYAVTSTTPPGDPDPRKAAVKIASYPVQPPLPPPPPVPEGAPAPPLAQVPAGFVQGAVAVVRETLTPELRQPTVLPQPVAKQVMPEVPGDAPLPGPLAAPSETRLRRHYVLVAVSPRGRESVPTAALSVPVDDASEPPTGLRLEYTESALTLSWEASEDAIVGPPVTSDPALLPSRPIVPPPPATSYHVFEAAKDAGAPTDPFSLTLPAPLTPQPVAVTTVAIPGPVRYGVERCFEVRAVDSVAGMATVGRASAPACLTPADTFPPAAPTDLAAIAGIGVINLIWAPNTEPDLAGYIVLRGTVPGGTLQALTPSPIRETTYRDQEVAPGVRYVYAVVAVDNASPQNVSGQSNRVEESSRTPR